jgi:hypothetical protein
MALPLLGRRGACAGGGTPRAPAAAPVRPLRLRCRAEPPQQQGGAGGGAAGAAAAAAVEAGAGGQRRWQSSWDAKEAGGGRGGGADYLYELGKSDVRAGRWGPGRAKRHGASRGGAVSSR